MSTTRNRDPRSSGSTGGRSPAGGRGRRKKHSKGLFWLQQIVVFTIAAVLVALLGGLVAFARLVKELPDSVTDIENFQPAGHSLIYSSDGSLLASLGEQNRQTVTIDHIPLDLQHATVAIEDDRFYTDHQGIDIRGIFRALFHNIQGGDMTGQGGSTIEQQVVRNLGIDGIGHEKTISRKIREAVYAYRIGQNYSKQQILEMYLNLVYYGSGAYGVEAAAETYFGKPVDQLDLAQSALLAGLVQRPSRLSPYVDKDAAKERRDTVLGRMRDLGYISAADCDVAQDEPIILAFAKPPSSGSKTYCANYFVDYVVKEITDKYGSDMLLRGGLRITTTLNWQMEKAAEEAVRDGVANNSYLGATDAALVAMEPQTGYIKAMVGGVDYAKSQYNIAAYGHRQPGSSFKPVIYTAALDSGLINENTRISDSPITLPGANGHNWTPHNDPGYIPSSEPKVWEAFAWSMNIPAVKVLRLVGVDTAIHYASIMGISSPLEPYLTLALGASAVTPLEMARMYSLIANQGALPTPEAIESITQSDGTVIEQDQPELETTSIRSDTLRQMGDMLRAVITDGTASKVFEDGNPPDAHGKTGTTQEHRDVWFDGYTSKLTCIVWAGHPSTDPVTGKPIYLPMHGEAFGATICAPIWKQFMIAANTVIAKQAAKEAAATKKTVTASSAAAKPKTPAAPVPTNATANPNVSSTSDAVYSADGKSVMVWVDDSTGMRASPNATGARQETFVPGSEPTTYADGSTATDTPPPARVTSSPTTETAPATSTSPPLESSVPLPSAPPTAPTPTPPVVHTNVVPSAAATPAEPKMVTVSICVESGMRATEWCPETIDKQFPANKIPKYCTLHKPPPGE